MAATQFYVYTDDQASSNDIAEQIIERFKLDYPDATSETFFDEDEELFSVTLTTEGDIEDVDTFLCEEICQENEFYCIVTDGSSKKEYYFDEDDEWIYK